MRLAGKKTERAKVYRAGNWIGMVRKTQRFVNIQWALGCGLTLFGVLNLIFPLLVVNISHTLSQDPTSHLWLVYALGLVLTGLGVAVLSEPQDTSRGANTFAVVLVGFLTLFSFLTLTFHLQNWWIDDAGITFAYSRSLAEGHGLVAQTWLPPEEGYSSSLWMLVLSFAAHLGANIPMAAKYIGIGCSALCISICAVIVARETRSTLSIVLCGVGIATGPTVVWSASGQEHALQSLLLLLVVLCVYASEKWRWPVAVILAVFVLTRPEAPIIVIAVFCAAVSLTRLSGRPFLNHADAAVALIPLLAFVGLIVFRMIYFGDPMPNPYYAKSRNTGFLSFFNMLGGGWSYILSGLRDTALLAVLWLLFMRPTWAWSEWRVIAVAVLLGQIFFVVWANGDWMEQYRFLMPILPVALLLAASSLTVVTAFSARMAFCTTVVLILAYTNTLQQAKFKNSPTTPMVEVTRVGNTFRSLADHIHIEDPLLAHHDAGGIAYHRMLRLADLGGLINRTIAQNMNDKTFLADYLVNGLQPDFVFGTSNFAAASGFADTDVFKDDYVPLDFGDLPHMRSDLSYIRRSRAIGMPGVELVYDGDGTLTRVLVTATIDADGRVRF